MKEVIVDRPTATSTGTKKMQSHCVQSPVIHKCGVIAGDSAKLLDV